MSRGTVASGFIAWFLLVTIASAETTEVRDALLRFMAQLTLGNGATLRGWNASSDPCLDLWTGVVCDSRSSSSVTKILLDDLKLFGPLDASSLCVADSLKVLSLSNNAFIGWLPIEVSNCSNLTHLYLNGNRLSGALPPSLSRCSKLERLDLSDNYFAGQLPDTSNMHGLVSFLAEQNRLSGNIPDFNFANLQEFNVSNNNLSGPIPVGGIYFGASSFSGNQQLCGPPLSNSCAAPSPSPAPALPY